MTFGVYSSLHRPRAHSLDEIPYGEPVVMGQDEVNQLHLDVHGLPHVPGSEGDCFLVTHVSPSDPDATPQSDPEVPSSSSSRSSESTGISRETERRVERFHRRDFATDPRCVVTTDELATLELVGHRSLRPDLKNWKFHVSPLPGKRFEVLAVDICLGSAS